MQNGGMQKYNTNRRAADLHAALLSTVAKGIKLGPFR
jgi:hypothetical protein